MSLLIGISNFIGRRAKYLRSAWETVFTQLYAPFRYRVAGGADNDDLPEKNGRAVINAIHGNTIKWNQLVKNGNFSNTDDWISWSISSCEITTFDNIATLKKKTNVSYGAFVYNDNFPTNSQHYYYLSAKLATVEAIASYGFIRNSGQEGGNTVLKSTTESLNRYSIITSPRANTDKLCLRCGISSTSIDDTCKAADVFAVDLTSIFGTDAEIADALGISTSDITTDVGVAAFESWLALNVGEQEYYPYDEGSLISFKGQGVKSVGFNKWDEQWERGSLSSSTGDNLPSSGDIRSENYIPVKPNTIYYIKCSKAVLVFGYDENKNKVARLRYAGGNANFTTTNKTYYVRFATYQGTYGDTYNHDICINVSNAAKNGTYEPYWSDEKPFDVTKVYGKLRGEGSLVQVFPNGMFEGLSDRLPEDYIEYSYGDIEAAADNKKIDLGDCAWSLVSGCSHTFETTIDITKAEAIGYTFSDEIDESDTTQDKLIGLVDGGSTKLALLDRSLSSTDLVSGHITALEGVDAVYYHPKVDYYRNLVYRDNGTDTPLEEIFPIKYKVDKYSTEELLVPASEAGEPTSTALVADIEYQKK